MKREKILSKLKVAVIKKLNKMKEKKNKTGWGIGRKSIFTFQLSNCFNVFNYVMTYL